MGFWERLVGDGLSEPLQDANPQKAELARQLEDIGAIKNYLSELVGNVAVLPTEVPAVRGCFNVLGLFVQMPHGKIDPSISNLRSAKSGWTLQAGDQVTVSSLDAWKLDKDTDWHIAKFRRGKWEQLVAPTLRLAQFLEELFADGEVSEERVRMVETIGIRFKASGKLKLPRVD